MIELSSGDLDRIELSSSIWYEIREMAKMGTLVRKRTADVGCNVNEECS